MFDFAPRVVTLVSRKCVTFCFPLTYRKIKRKKDEAANETRRLYAG